MDSFLRGVDALTRAMMVLAAFCAFALAFLILLDVLARNTAIRFYGVPEYIRNWLIVIVFLQLPFAVRIRSMLAVDIFVGLLPPVTRTPIAIFGYALGALFFGAVAFGGLSPAIDAWLYSEYEGEGVVEVAAWPARFTIVGGCALAAFYYLVRIYDAVLGREQGSAADLPKPIEQL